ncbi:mariner Mos1 transposase [Trichonephila clavipes]|nr:mariner Mos1 transposase [Trichonephila clavipes]
MNVKKFKTLMSATKVRLTIFWDASGVFYTEFLTKGLTVNSNTVHKQRMSWDGTMISQPPYSPDLAPSDFWLFPKLKNTLEGQRFSMDAEVQAAVRKWIRSQSESFYKNGMKKWIE